MNEFFTKYGDFMGWGISKIIDQCDRKQDNSQKETIKLNIRASIRITIQIFLSIVQLFFTLFIYVPNVNVKPAQMEVGWDFQIILISWGIYDIYLIFIEGHYILNGENDIEFRETWNQTIDIVQNLFLISSLIVSLIINETDSNWRIGCVILFSGDTVLGIIELFIKKNNKFFRVAQEKTSSNRVLGTKCIFLFFIMPGNGFALVTLLCMQILFDPWYNIMFIVFICSNCTLSIFTIMIGQYYMYCKSCEGCDGFNGKNFLNMAYGLTFGICSVYFAPIADLILIYIFLRKYCFKCSWIPEVEQ